MEEFKGLSQTITALRKNLDFYFERYETDSSLIIGTFLSPYHKLRYWPNVDEDSSYSLSSIREQLCEAYGKYGPPEDRQEIDNIIAEEVGNQEAQAPNLEKDKKFNITDWGEARYPATQSGDPSIKTNLPQLSTYELIDLEIKTFLDFEEPKEGDPVIWWKTHKDRLPKLAILANKYLCAPPSSVESERLFSVGGRIYTPLRSRLTPKNGEILMTLSHNIRHFQEHKF